MILIIRNLARRTLPGWMGLAGAMLVLAGCANNYPDHLTYTDTSEEGALVTGIQTYQFNLTTGPRFMQAGAAAQDGEVGDLNGAATRHSTLFGLVEWGNNGVGEAARNGGVREVRTVQNGGIDILWGIVYSEQSTIVTGQEAYANPLPLKFPTGDKTIQEGMFLEPNHNLVVKNTEDQILSLVKEGEMGKEIIANHQKFHVSYGVFKDGDQAILIQPDASSNQVTLLVNDQIATFQPQGCLILKIDAEKFVKAYEANPEGSVQVTPVSLWSNPLAVADKQKRELVR